MFKKLSQKFATAISIDFFLPNYIRSPDIRNRYSYPLVRAYFSLLKMQKILVNMNSPMISFSYQIWFPLFLFFLYQILVQLSLHSHTLLMLSRFFHAMIHARFWAKSFHFSFPALQKKNSLQNLYRIIAYCAHFPYDYAKIFILSKTFVCIYYIKSIRIGSTNKTGRCAKVSRYLTQEEGWTFLLTVSSVNFVRDA